jgi:hypothetical protein
MRLLSHKHRRFDDVIRYYSTFYTSTTNQKERLTLSIGVLNFIWNHWNNFWRDYWIAHVSGGYDLNNNPITSIHNNYTDKQCCHYLLYACGKRRNHNHGDAILGTYQEATWGDPTIITRIATTMLSHHTNMSYLLGLIGHYQIYIEHFQTIRNTFIHLNNENVYNLNSITGHYRFTSGQGLINILDTVEIYSSTRCFDNLLDNMTGLIDNLA